MSSWIKAKCERVCKGEKYNAAGATPRLARAEQSLLVAIDSDRPYRACAKKSSQYQLGRCHQLQSHRSGMR